MFEHMKNYKTLLSRVASWLAPGGRLFVHIFVHKAGLPYHYEVRPAFSHRITLFRTQARKGCGEPDQSLLREQHMTGS